MSERPTLRERMAQLEAKMDYHTKLLTDHITNDEKRSQLLLRMLGTLVVGVILFALPGCVRLLAEVL